MSVCWYNYIHRKERKASESEEGEDHKISSFYFKHPTPTTLSLLRCHHSVYCEG